MKKVAVIILNYNSWRETLNEITICVNVLNMNYKDIIVVDNASPNDSALNLKKESGEKGFIFLQSKENKGYSSGNNIGLRYAYDNKYEYALILNNDILFDDKMLVEKMLDIFSKNNHIAVVNTDVFSPDGHMFNRDAKKPTFFDYTLGTLMYRKRGRLIEDLGGYAYIYRPQGCCMMVDLNKMNEIDYMDEHTFLYFEEPILAERLLKKNYRCALCITSKIIHNHSTTINSNMDRRKRRHVVHKSFRYYLREYRNFSTLQINICIFLNCLKMLVEQ